MLNRNFTQNDKMASRRQSAPALQERNMEINQHKAFHGVIAGSPKNCVPPPLKKGTTVLINESTSSTRTAVRATI